MYEILKELEQVYQIAQLDIYAITKEIIKSFGYRNNLLFIKGILYEELENHKLKKIRLSKIKTEELAKQLRERLLYEQQKKDKQIILDLYPNRIFKGVIVGEDNLSYIVKDNKTNYKFYMLKNKINKTYSINEENYFYIQKIQFKKHIPYILVTTKHKNLINYKIKEMFGHKYFLKEIRDFKDKIIIRSYPKLEKADILLLKGIYQKMIISKGLKDG